MPRENWAENSADRIFLKAGLWPFASGELKNVLDVGCGLSLKSQYLDIPVRVGVDIYPEYLNRIDAVVPYATVVGDVRQLDKMFLEKSFDLVLALDIIEHVEMDESRALLESLEKIARKAVVIMTPNGFSPQNMDIWGYGGDHWQTHRCGWTAKELEDRGYKVLVRDYKMSDVKRHTETHVAPEMQMLDAIRVF